MPQFELISKYTRRGRRRYVIEADTLEAAIDKWESSFTGDLPFTEVHPFMGIAEDEERESIREIV